MAKARDDLLKAIMRDEMFAAIFANDDAKMALCLQKGGDPDARDGHNAPLLSRALANSRTNLAKMLITGGADMNVVDGSGSPALFTAITNCVDAAITMIDRGADTTLTDANSEKAPCLATEKGRIDIIKALVRAGADFNVRGASGKTPLMIAVLNHPENRGLLEEILKGGADIAQADRNGKTVFQLIDESASTSHAIRQHKEAIKMALLGSLPDSTPRTAMPPAPVDPRVKEDTESAPMPELKKKPFTPQPPAERP